MTDHLAQLNIAWFRLSQKHLDNAELANNLDRVNQKAEPQNVFIWGFTGDASDTLDIKVFDALNIVSTMSLWATLESLIVLVYRSKERSKIMPRRHQWFDTIDLSLVLRWVRVDNIRSLDDAKMRF